MEFLEVSKKLEETDLKEAEEQLGISFTNEFKEHYLKYNGGYPVKSFFLWPDDGAKTRINHFFSIKYDGFSRFETAYENLFITEQILPQGFLPFAVDDGGDYFCISILPQFFNQVFFFDMHHYDPGWIEEYVTLISESFKGFIDNLVDE
ncbi:MAG: SMI1/KNR4 family protein [Mucilaginibacter sp.]|uniref:SMI1/KNR4 family protein n=1 Tax=Mucilaginibacter sp. TaxID=1882438 RepID=UPI003564D303